jgi:hypothetical protein
VNKGFNTIPVVTISFAWEELTNSTQSTWLFLTRKSVGEVLKAEFKGPPIYRFVFYKDSKQWAYVGESQNFTKRYLRYRYKTKSSEPISYKGMSEALENLHANPNVRISTEIALASDRELKVGLQILKFDEFSFNGTLICEKTLACPFTRRALENLAILDTRASGMHVMNRGYDFGTHDWRERRKDRVNKRLKNKAGKKVDRK